MEGALRSDQGRDTERVVMYVAIALVLVILATVGVFRYHYRAETRAAIDKATQLEAKWRVLGLAVPEQDVLVRLYGTDGGVLCTITPDRVTKALYLIQMSNGAAGPGQRPVIVPEKAIAAGRAMLEVYCPERLDAFDSIVSGLKLSSGT
jgi:hypothetical protein